MSDAFSPKVGFDGGVSGGDSLNVRSGGSVVVEDGGSLTGTRIQRRQISCALTSATALTSGYAVRSLVSVELPITVKSIRFLSNGAISGHASSNATFVVNKISALATATTAVASLTFTTGNAVTAYVPVTITLTTSLSVAAGESLVQNYTFASSGLDVPVGQVTVDYVVDAT